jgi:enoyl-CoA hydratase/carnithine racemase
MNELTVSAPEDGVVLVELNRPPGNLWTAELCLRLTELLERPPAGAHIVRLRSAGDVFCLGREREGATTPGQLRAEAQVLTGLHRAQRRTNLVMVAEIDGDAAGFGVGIAAGCDVAVATARSTFSFPEVGIGLAPAVVLAWLPRIVGERTAFWLTATGESISAERAVDLGLINAVAPTAADLRQDVDARINQLRKHNPRVHGDIKEMLRVFGSATADQALDISVDRLVVGSQRRTEE